MPDVTWLDIIVGGTLVAGMSLVVAAWRRRLQRGDRLSRWSVAAWSLWFAAGVAIELAAQFDRDPTTFTLSEGLTGSFDLRVLMLATFVIFVELEFHWRDLVSRGFGIATRGRQTKS